MFASLPNHIHIKNSKQSVRLLETLDNERIERARLAIVASTILNVFDIIEQSPLINTKDYMLVAL